MNMLRLEKGRHYGDYIQSAENIEARPMPNNVIRFRIIKWREYPVSIAGYYEPVDIGPETDLSDVDLKHLEQFDEQLYYCGEVGRDDPGPCNPIRALKFSPTRTHIQEWIKRKTEPLRMPAAITQSQK